jgi:hypothetical protein
LLSHAAQLFNEAVQMEPNDSKSLYKWANCLVQLAKQEPDPFKVDCNQTHQNKYEEFNFHCG